ncbi:MAG: hypothetical protein C0399_12565 [Syntrophus sp. (in: bacteria)]|nr:hypothetical protein [Syntrophus sp. (in: bacteria)]
MHQEATRETWEELCFHLSDTISSSINEALFEQKALLALEKLGWNQFRGEIKVKPVLQIGRQNHITPDIVVYAPDNKAIIVLEIKRPAEDINRHESIGQLQSYMRQTKADFGLLVGNEIHVYYDGTLNPHHDPLLLSRIPFKSDSARGVEFVNIFNKNSFLKKEYEPYLKASIDRLEKEQRIDKLKKCLLSEETSQKILKLLQHEFSDVEAEVLREALSGLSIKMYYAAKSRGIQETIFICKNKHSGKHFIFVDDSTNGEVFLINPEGVTISLKPDLFDEPKDESVDYLLSYKLITETQLRKYRELEVQQPEKKDELRDTNLDFSNRRRNQTPSASEWSKGVPELSNISNLDNWRAICDHLRIEVEGDSARRRLKKWAIRNRPHWPPVPPPR